MLVRLRWLICVVCLWQAGAGLWAQGGGRKAAAAGQRVEDKDEAAEDTVHAGAEKKGFTFDFDGKGSKTKKPDKLELDPRNIVAGPFGDRLDLTPGWLIHPGGGDFAGPAVGDADWQTVDTRKAMFMNGLFAQNEVWYRVHVRLPAGVHGLALRVADFGGSYRVYANGVELGGHGRMAGLGDYLVSRSTTYAIPDEVPGAGELVVAIHAFLGKVDRGSLMLEDGISPKTRVYLGPANVLYRDQAVYFAAGASESVAIRTLWAVLLALTVGLWILIPRVKVYPVLAVFTGCHLFGWLLTDWGEFHYYAQTAWFTLAPRVLLLVSDLALLEFFRVMVGVKKRRASLVFAVVYVLAVASLMPAAMGLVPFALWGIANKVVHSTLYVWCAVLLAIGIKRRREDALVMASVGGLYCFYMGVWWMLGRVVFFWHVLTQLADAFVRNVHPVEAWNLAVVVAFTAVVLVRTLRIVRERAAIATEIEAARTMQQLLLTASNRPTPGFTVESVYLPAGEVGGDFFLVSPCADGDEEPSLTVVVGDVSGKGLRAAMRVSMILGVLRREPSREPAAMLRGLNQALADEGGNDEGFTTACCVRVSPDGRYTVANAGHIAPYVAGVELETPPALPLGLMAMAEGEGYELVTGRLSPGQRLVLMSDGVAEARGHRGELYGFDRLAPLTLRPAAEIARTAQQFGQDDDITVVTIGCAPRTTHAAPPPAGATSGAVPPPVPVGAATA